MKRRLLTILSTLSLLLCVTVVALWVRSYWRWDSLASRGEQHLYTLDSGSGHVGVAANRQAGTAGRKFAAPFLPCRILAKADLSASEVGNNPNARFPLTIPGCDSPHMALFREWCYPRFIVVRPGTVASRADSATDNSSPSGGSSRLTPA